MHSPRSSANPLILSLLASLLLVTNVTRAQPADWAIDPEHFSIAFGAGHIGFQEQLGMFLEASGSFRYDPATRELSSGRVEVRADSVFTNHDDRDDHLRGRDFLNVSRNPVIAFEATGFTPDGEDERRGTLTGNLTMLGETHSVELEVTINKQGRYPFGHRNETLGISAHTTILRSRWGMDYGVADNLVGDEVRLRFELEALRQ